MIQRIQTIWLLLAAAAAFLTLKFSFYSGNIIVEGAKTFQNLTARSQIVLTILSAGVGLAALITIFLYKNRKQQMRIILLALLVSLVNIVLFFFGSAKVHGGQL